MVPFTGSGSWDINAVWGRRPFNLLECVPPKDVSFSPSVSWCVACMVRFGEKHLARGCRETLTLTCSSQWSVKTRDGRRARVS